MMMNLSFGNLAAALLWTLVAGLGAWLLLWPLRRRSLTWLLASLAITGAAASTGAMWGAIETMLIPHFDWKALVALSVFTTLVVGIAAYTASRRLAMDADSVVQAVAELGEGRVPTVTGPPLTAEIDRIRRELHSTATALAETRAREQALDAARRDLVSALSHDLRTPLAGLRAMAEALEDGVVDDPEIYYKQMSAAVDRLNAMVEDLFDLSRIQAGHVSRENESIALDDLVSDCVAALEPLAASHGVQLVGSVGGMTSVLGNGRELNRAVTNLVANAIRHTPPGGTVDVRVGTLSGAVAEVGVSDACGGIPAHHLPHVFEIGFRGEQARTPHGAKAGGAGLGLAITRGIVEAHRGTVDVTNIPGGCRFRVRLPVGG